MSGRTSQGTRVTISAATFLAVFIGAMAVGGAFGFAGPELVALLVLPFAVYALLTKLNRRAESAEVRSENA